MTARQYKDFQNLKKENLRDNMSILERARNMLAEAMTERTKTENPIELKVNKETAGRDGTIAGNEKKETVKETGEPVITKKSAVDFSRRMEGATKKTED